MPYFVRVFPSSDAVPPLDDIRILAAQYGATVAAQDLEDDWDSVELHWHEDELPVEIERYLPATDGLFEEDLMAARSAAEAADDGPPRSRVLSALQACQQIVAFRVPSESDEDVFGPLNAAVDAVTGAVGGLIHAEAEGFYDGVDLILPTE